MYGLLVLMVSDVQVKLQTMDLDGFTAAQLSNLKALLSQQKEAADLTSSSR